jgi:ribonuclease Z
MFPLPFRTPTDTTQAQFPTNAEFLQPYHHVRMQPAAKGSILPRAAKDIPYPSTDGDVQIAKRRLEDTLPDYVTACSKARRSVRADPRWTSEQKETGDDILVTTLGTGSAMPSNHRNVSSTHLDIPDLGGILLDAGEGTLGQLRRGFGPEGVAQLYGKLRMIFISHMHADHHLGLQSVLEDRFRVSSPPSYHTSGVDHGHSMA